MPSPCPACDLSVTCQTPDSQLIVLGHCNAATLQGRQIRTASCHSCFTASVGTGAIRFASVMGSAVDLSRGFHCRTPSARHCAASSSDLSTSSHGCPDPTCKSDPCQTGAFSSSLFLFGALRPSAADLALALALALGVAVLPLLGTCQTRSSTLDPRPLLNLFCSGDFFLRLRLRLSNRALQHNQPTPLPPPRHRRSEPAALAPLPPVQSEETQRCKMLPRQILASPPPAQPNRTSLRVSLTPPQLPEDLHRPPGPVRNRNAWPGLPPSQWE